jgi:hypothetical protein
VDERALGLLRTAGRATTVSGGVGSVVLVLWVGRGNPSLLLMVLFSMWVLAPFVALLVVDRLSPRWSVLSRATVHTVMVIVGIASLVAYGGVAGRLPHATSASMFVIIPVLSWLVMTIVLPLVAFISNRR